MARENPPDTMSAAVAVFCGAKNGTNIEFKNAARDLAHALHAEGWKLVYGGGTVGMMGEISRTLVELSGPQAVHGIIPEALVSVERKRNPDDTQDEQKRLQMYGRLTIVSDMHARKAMMAAEASAFVALPGGFGTMEELMEIITWNFLGIHDKPIVIFNVDGYYDSLLEWIEKAIRSGFVDEANKRIVLSGRTAAEVIGCIKGYRTASGRHNIDWNIK